MSVQTKQVEMSMTLEEFVEEGIRLGIEKGFYPAVFQQMRQHYTLEVAIEKLVRTNETKKGFLKMESFGLKEWTLEAAVLKFPTRFSKEAGVYAKARFDGII